MTLLTYIFFITVFVNVLILFDKKHFGYMFTVGFTIFNLIYAIILIANL